MKHNNGIGTESDYQIPDLNSTNPRATRAAGCAPPTPTIRPATSTPRTVSVYARYIGRVGALAVALGVTGALATNPGVAWADDTASKTGSSSSSTDADSGSTATKNTKTADTKPAAAAPAASSTSTTGEDPTAARTTGTTDAQTADDDTDTDTDDAEDLDAEDLEAEDTDAEEPEAELDPVESGAEPEPPVDELPIDEPPADEPDGQTDLEPGTGEQAAPPSDGADIPSTTTPEAPEPPAPAPENATESAGDTGPEVQEGGADTAGAEDPADTVAARTQAAEFTTNHAAAAVVTTNTNPIAAALSKLPTPQQVIADIKRTVTQCACNFINQAIKLVNGFTSMPASNPAAPGAPGETPIAWAVLGWVRRQMDLAVTAFNRSPIGQFVNQAVTRVTDAIADFGNSPFGREFSASITQFLQECSGSTALPADLDRISIVGGLNEPTDFDFLTHINADGEEEIHRIFITEKSGAVKVYDPQTGTTSTLVNLPTVNANGERGLVGIEIDPQFWDAGADGYHKIYVAYTAADNYDQLAQLSLDDSLQITGDPVVLLKSTELGGNFHHGGEIEFDPTGEHIYWAVGDNTNGANAQDLSNIHGKILRLNRDGSAPEDNPFFNTPGAVQQIYAYGLRNPFRFTVTPDGVLLAGDVGEASWEELNVITAGGNYGWPGAEGNCSTDQCSSTIDPLYAYAHTLPPANVGSITSILYYTGTTLPEQYRNKVFIADYSVGWIKELTFDDQFTSLISERTLDSSAGATVKLMQGADGNIYQLNIYPGTLSIITASGGNRAPAAVIDASATSGAGDSLTVDFDAAGSTDLDGDGLTYQWNFGNGQTSTDAAPTITFTNTGDEYTAYTVTLTVNDGQAANTTTQRIVVGSTPPTAEIQVSDNNYDAGGTISFNVANGSDPEDGTLPDSAYKWTVVFHHAEHTHPFQDNIEGTEGEITIPQTPDQLANTWYRIHLTVTDSSGLTTTTYKDVRPNLVTLTFTSNQPDAVYTIDGQPRRGTYTEQAVVGVRRVLGAPETQSVAAGQLVFSGWSDGGARNHAITTPGTDSGYTVTFDLADADADAGTLV